MKYSVHLIPSSLPNLVSGTKSGLPWGNCWLNCGGGERNRLYLAPLADVADEPWPPGRTGCIVHTPFGPTVAWNSKQRVGPLPLPPLYTVTLLLLLLFDLLLSQALRMLLFSSLTLAAVEVSRGSWSPTLGFRVMMTFLEEPLMLLLSILKATCPGI